MDEKEIGQLKWIETQQVCTIAWISLESTTRQVEMH